MTNAAPDTGQGSERARWRIGGPLAATVLALIIAAGAAVVGWMMAGYERSAGAPSASAADGVGVIAFATGGALVVRNASTEDVFIESLAIESAPFAYFGHVILGAVARAGTFQVIPQPPVPTGPLIGNVADKVWQQVLDKQFPDVQPRFYSAGHVYLRAIREQIGDDVRSIPARCRLSYHGLTSAAPLTVGFECTGVFVRIDSGGGRPPATDSRPNPTGP